MLTLKEIFSVNWPSKVSNLQLVKGYDPRALSKKPGREIGLSRIRHYKSPIRIQIGSFSSVPHNYRPRIDPDKLSTEVCFLQTFNFYSCVCLKALSNYTYIRYYSTTWPSGTDESIPLSKALRS